MNREIYLQKFIARAAERVGLTARLVPSDVCFPSSYAAITPPRRAARDLVLLGLVDGSARPDLCDLTPASPQEDGGRSFDLRIFSAKPRALDALMPLLRNLGLPVLDQNQFTVMVGASRRYIRSFRIQPTGDEKVREYKKAILAAFGALLRGDAEDDSLNQLVVRAGAGWREVDLLRAYCNYYLQLEGRIGRSRFYEALIGQSAITRLLLSYFEARFRPDGPMRGSLDALADIRQSLVDAFDQVVNVTDDRILRDVFNLIDSTLRTNFYITEKTIALKIDSLGVISAPHPKPALEIYVHSTSFEGIHLRGAKVARGGIRWSDRTHDFRTEILDLMQTQMVKNALIVPQGAKGGFVLKRTVGDGPEREVSGKAAYREFISALLDLTDNTDYRNDRQAAGMVVYDDWDPYLVVAADKGTATWSDIANEISLARGFWLGDAFATGGSNGFHHKRLGITARGAWVCVRRHFRELNRNIDDQPFTVVGVGSMDGDVFGNGMLETTNIRLLGAFSGEHVFIDPNPDPLISYAERRRLYETPRSSWNDYDRTKISMGGGVYRRDAKDIELSPEARALLQARNRLVDGEALIRLLLTAPVDLLWMGGIGTYVKASFETDESVGDKANDGARVDANQLRAKVAGEGANLAFTPQARVEFALKGGQINSDAIDNSAGVDLSDHEVNLKIVLASGGASSDAEPNQAHRRLADTTDEVCSDVLDDSDHQSLCLSLERRRSAADVSSYMDLADRLEAAGRLDRQDGRIPRLKEIQARAEKGLTRPELALLMAHAKLSLKRALLEAPDFLDENWASAFLLAYFPLSMRRMWEKEIHSHPLGREIAVTVICNKVIDQSGARFLLFDETAAPGVLVDAVGIYLTFDKILEGARWRRAIRDLSDRMTSERQYVCLQQLEDTLIYMCRWALQRGYILRPQEDVVAEWRDYLKEFFVGFQSVVEAAVWKDESGDVEAEIFGARMREFPFMVDLARRAGKDIAVATQVFDRIVERLGLAQIAVLLAKLTARDAWEGQLQQTLEERLRAVPARIASVVLHFGANELETLLEIPDLRSSFLRHVRLREEVLSAAPTTIAPFALFLVELESFAEAFDRLKTRAYA
jgi:glutamate dehydrogenase